MSQATIEQPDLALESSQTAAEPAEIVAFDRDTTYDHYEVVDGQRVELPPMGAYEAEIASVLDQHLGHFARMHALGRVVTKALFALIPGKPRRRPDVAFVSFDRYPRGRRVPSTDAWEVVPDLAIKVVSPSDRAVEVVVKVGEYFKAGVRLVWVIYPERELIDVYDAPTRIRVLERADTLDGGDVLPGFGLPLASLFEGAGPTETAQEPDALEAGASE